MPADSRISADLPTNNTPNWQHAPVHILVERGIYICTAGTYQKQLFFNSPERREFLHDLLLTIATEFGWHLHAWAVFANHYHFVAASPADPKTLRKFTSKLHTLSAMRANREDNTPGRKVWHEFWDTRLTFEASYLARLNYVNQNPVRHGLVTVASQYPWCSAAYFERNAPKSFQATVNAMPIDRLAIEDDF